MIFVFETDRAFSCRFSRSFSRGFYLNQITFALLREALFFLFLN